MKVEENRIILASHCILNPFSKTRGSVQPWIGFMELIDLIYSNNVGIYQLPCPEFTYGGLRRWGQSKEQYNNPFFKAHCEKIISIVIQEIIDYQDNGFTLIGLLGIKGSPSCGMNHTYSADWGGEFQGIQKQGSFTKGSGVFIETFSSLLKQSDLDLPFLEVDEENINKSLDVIRKVL